MIRGKPHAWSPSVALNTASSLLYFIYESISGAESTRTAERCLRERQERKEVPRQWPVFRISFEPGRRQASLQVQELPQQADSEGRVGILTRSYVENVLERMERRPKKYVCLIYILNCRAEASACQQGAGLMKLARLLASISSCTLLALSRGWSYFLLSLLLFCAICRLCQSIGR